MGARAGDRRASRRPPNELGIPVVSGNVSLYNETGGRPIPPTPVVGCVGLVARRDADPVALARAATASSSSAARAPSSCASSGRTRTASRSRTTSPTAASRSRSREAAAWSGRRGRRSTRRRGPGRRSSRCAPGDEPLDWPDVVELGDRLMCGVFGIRAPGRDVARLTYFGLHALQHRGQESAGIAVSERRPADGAARPRARHAGLRRAEPARASTASSRSGTRATRRPARTRGRTRSRCSTTAARARSRSGTTAT